MTLERTPATRTNKSNEDFSKRSTDADGRHRRDQTVALDPPSAGAAHGGFVSRPAAVLAGVLGIAAAEDFVDPPSASTPTTISATTTSAAPAAMPKRMRRSRRCARAVAA
jgi:hypothetical protein